MVKKLVLILTIALILPQGCAEEKYGDIKKIMKGIIKAQEKFISESDGISDPKEMAAAINDLAEDMADFRSRMNALEKKYPELAAKSEIPVELKELLEKMCAVSIMLEKSRVKTLMKFVVDPDVQKAAANLASANR